MDFNIASTPEEEAFREAVQAFLKQESADIEIINNARGSYSEDGNVATRRMARKLGQKGWLSLTWPKEYGGRGAAGIPLKLVFTEETSKVNLPGVNGFGLEMLAPILLANGTEEQKRRHLIPLGKGEVVWCEGFSEPNAGSDLFSLQTRAVDNGDCFIVNGQKIWTTGAHRSDWGFFLVRTDPNAPRKHLGISFLLIDMKSPGVSVRPIQNMAGAFDFCETFLDEVRVPKENLVGKLNDGARGAGALLNAERSSLILVGRGARRSVDRLTSYLKESEQTGSLRSEKEVWMYRLADVAIKAEIAGLFGKYAYWLQSQGRDYTLMASLGKVFSSELSQQITDLGTQLLGLHGQLMRGSKRAWQDGIIGQTYLTSHQSRLLGGSSEIQRTTIATRGLGLPRR
jgi:alkylation response protein AidB-like acyl-CoA dehydrogenase